MELKKWNMVFEIFQIETRIYCGFRKKMIQEENKPCSEVAFRWLVFRIFDIKWQKSIVYEKQGFCFRKYSTL